MSEVRRIQMMILPQEDERRILNHHVGALDRATPGWMTILSLGAACGYPQQPKVSAGQREVRV